MAQMEDGKDDMIVFQNMEESFHCKNFKEKIFQILKMRRKD